MAKDDQELFSHRGPGQGVTRKDLQDLKRKPESAEGKPRPETGPDNPAKEPRRPGTPKL